MENWSRADICIKSKFASLLLFGRWLQLTYQQFTSQIAGRSSKRDPAMSLNFFTIYYYFIKFHSITNFYKLIKIYKFINFYNFINIYGFTKNYNLTELNNFLKVHKFIKIRKLANRW